MNRDYVKSKIQSMKIGDSVFFSNVSILEIRNQFTEKIKKEDPSVSFILKPETMGGSRGTRVYKTKSPR